MKFNLVCLHPHIYTNNVKLRQFRYNPSKELILADFLNALVASSQTALVKLSGHNAQSLLSLGTWQHQYPKTFNMNPSLPQLCKPETVITFLMEYVKVTPHVHCLTFRIDCQGKFISGMWTSKPLKASKEVGDIVPVLSVLRSSLELGSADVTFLVSVEFCPSIVT